MSAGTIISIIGTGITLLSFLLDSVPDTSGGEAKVSYVIANDGANGDLEGAGGNLPDLRMWDETAEFLGITTEDNSDCGEGYTTCTSTVSTNEAPTYTLFTGNDDAICIAWTGIAFPGGNQKFGFHPGQWAYGCSQYGNGGGTWYYAGTSVPGINEADETVYCAWLDSNGDVETTGFQVHWPEFEEGAGMKDIGYYCDNNPPVNFRTENDPSDIKYWTMKRDLFSSSPSVGRSEGAAPKANKKRLSAVFENDPRVFKSHRAHHPASKLCDPNGGAAGQSFVSYAEKKFCHMPTKTLYGFCEDVDSGACWDDAANAVIAKGDNLRIQVPDMSHISKTVVWE